MFSTGGRTRHADGRLRMGAIVGAPTLLSLGGRERTWLFFWSSCAVMIPPAFRKTLRRYSISAACELARVGLSLFLAEFHSHYFDSGSNLLRCPGLAECRIPVRRVSPMAFTPPASKARGRSCIASDNPPQTQRHCRSCYVGSEFRIKCGGYGFLGSKFGQVQPAAFVTALEA